MNTDTPKQKPLSEMTDGELTIFFKNLTPSQKWEVSECTGVPFDAFVLNLFIQRAKNKAR